MDKDTILAKSREEHKNQDLYKQQLETQASNLGVVAATLLATLFFVVQLLAGKGLNLGLYAIPFCVGAAQFVYKAVRMHHRRDIVLAVVYCAVTLALAAVHLYGVVAG